MAISRLGFSTENMKLRGDDGGHRIVDAAADENDPLLQQARENVVLVVAAARLLPTVGMMPRMRSIGSCILVLARADGAAPADWPRRAPYLTAGLPAATPGLHWEREARTLIFLLCCGFSRAAGRAAVIGEQFRG